MKDKVQRVCSHHIDSLSFQAPDDGTCGRKYENYPLTQATCVGIGQIITGTLCASFSLAAFSFAGHIERYHNEEYFYGIWTGFFVSR